MSYLSRSLVIAGTIVGLGWNTLAASPDDDLRKAAQQGRLAEVRSALRQPGVNVDAPDKDGRTALMLAAENGQDVIVQYLVRNGAQLGLRDKKGESAHDKAVKKQRTQAAAFLVMSAAFQSAKQQDTARAWEQFLSQHGAAQYDEVAAATEEFDRRLWADAERLETRASYAVYLEKRPRGAFTGPANSRIRVFDSVLVLVSSVDSAALLELVREVARPYLPARLAAEVKAQQAKGAYFSMGMNSTPGVTKLGARITVESAIIGGFRAQVTNYPTGCEPKGKCASAVSAVFEDSDATASQEIPYRRVTIAFEDIDLAAKHAASKLLEASQVDGRSVLIGQYVLRANQWHRIVSGPAMR